MRSKSSYLWTNACALHYNHVILVESCYRYLVMSGLSQWSSISRCFSQENYEAGFVAGALYDPKLLVDH